MISISLVASRMRRNVVLYMYMQYFEEPEEQVRGPFSLLGSDTNT